MPAVSVAMALRGMAAGLIVTSVLVFAVAPPVWANDQAAVAARALLDAGGEKLEHDQVVEAIVDLRKALELAWESKDGPLVGNVYRYLGIALLRNGDLEKGQDAIDHSLEIYKLMGDGNEMLLTLRVAVTLARSLKNRDLTIRYLNETAALYELVGEFERQAVELEKILYELKLPEELDTMRDVVLRMQQAYEKSGNTVGQADARAALGWYKEMSGDTAGALADYDAAIALYRDVDNRRDALGKMLNQSAELLRAQGRYSQALPLQEEALGLAREAGDEDAIAQSLNNLALVNQELGRHGRAAELIDESVAITRQRGNVENLATSLINAASIYRDLGRYDEGIALLDEVFRLAREEGGIDDERRRAGQILSTIHHARGDPISAAAAAMVAESFSGQEGKAPSVEDSVESHNFAASLIALGNYEKAIEILEGLLDTATRNDDLVGMASANEALGAAYEESDRYMEAERHLLETIRIQKELNDIVGQARTLSNLGTVYRQMGRYYEALDRYDEASSIVATLDAPLMQVQTLLSMAQVYRQLRRYPQGLAKAERALALSRAHGFEAQTVSALNAAALLNLHMGHYAESERLYRAADSESDTVAGSVINDGLVEVLLATGRYEEALEELAGVEADVLAGAAAGYRLQYYTQRGIATYGLGKANDAFADFSRAMNEAEQIRRQFAGRDSQGFFDAGSYGGRIRPYRGAVEVLAAGAVAGATGTVTIGSNTYDLVSGAFHYTEFMRGRNLVEKSAQREFLEKRHTMPPEVRAREEALTEQLMALGAEVARKSDAGEKISDAEVEAFERLRAELNAHLTMLRKDYPKYAMLFSPGTISVADVPVNEGETVLEYVFGLDNVFLFVIRAGEPVTLLRLPVSAADLQDRVRVFRDLLVSKRYDAALGLELYRMLLSGAIEYVGEHDALVIVPDGLLGLLPFEALPMSVDTQGEAEHFLGAVHRISYAQSASLLTMQRNSVRAAAGKAFFGLGDPIFGPDDPRFRQLMSSAERNQRDRHGVLAGTRGGRSYKRLPETRLEVAVLAAINKVTPRPPDVLVGKHASETMLRETGLSAYRILHFATHAEADGIPGLVNEPFLVLSQVNNDADSDGLLTMNEIMQLDLRADLVVLAACETGGGTVFEGDGVASLASAFQFAGSRSVLLSLWEVPSRATLYFMRDFYTNLKAGHSEGEALALSREAMRQRYPDPYFWSVFVLYGGGRH